MYEDLALNFKGFLKNISLNERQRAELIKEHNRLKKYLLHDSNTKDFIVTTFIQGSFARKTSIVPLYGKRTDLDIVVVTNLDKHRYSADDVLDRFEPVLKKHYGRHKNEQYRRQAHSWGLKLSNVDIDIVPATSQVLMDKVRWATGTLWQPFYLYGKPLDWRQEPLYIPDTTSGRWEETNPLKTKCFVKEKNVSCNGNYSNIVKCFKWWKKYNFPKMKHPSGYQMEALVGQYCPNDVRYVEEGIVRTFENLLRCGSFKSGLSWNRNYGSEVYSSMSQGEYFEFYNYVKEAAKVAKEAVEAAYTEDAIELWRSLFGGKFPRDVK